MSHRRRKHECHSHGKCHKKKRYITQKDLRCNNGIVIRKRGVYKVKTPLFWKGKGPAIKIVADNVTLDFANNVLDLKGEGHQGVKVTSKNVEILNGTVINSALPTPVFVAGDDDPDDILDSAVEIPPQAIIDIFGIPKEFADVDPKTGDYVGIGIHLAEGASNITIESMTTNDCYVGIGSTTRLENLVIKNSKGFDCGTDVFTDDPVFNEQINTLAMRNRGGFIILQDQNPEVLFDNFDIDLDQLPADKISHHIYVENCETDGAQSSAGVVIWRASHVHIENVVSGTTGNNLSGFIECRPIAVFLSQDIVTRNCSVFIGNSGFQFLASRRIVIEDCDAENCTDQGFDLDTLKYCTARRCNANGSSAQPGQLFVPVGTGLKGLGMSIIFSDNVLIEDCTASNFLTGFGIGFIIFKNNNSTIKNCTAYNNVFGIAAAAGFNNALLDNLAYNNKLAGITDNQGNTDLGTKPTLYNIPVALGNPFDPNTPIVTVPTAGDYTAFNFPNAYGSNFIFRNNRAFGNAQQDFNGVTPVGNYSNVTFVENLNDRLTNDLPVVGYNLILDV